MNLYELTKKYGEGKGDAIMWKVVRVISEAVEEDMDDKAKSRMMRCIYGIMTDRHYTEEVAIADVKGMYYTDANGNKHDAPYWPEEAVQNIYEEIRKQIPDYNFWDFYTTLNMLMSDSYRMLREWFPRADESEMNIKITDMAVAWLNDEDWPTKTKIWDYLSAR